MNYCQFFWAIPSVAVNRALLVRAIMYPCSLAHSPTHQACLVKHTVTAWIDNWAELIRLNRTLHCTIKHAHRRSPLKCCHGDKNVTTPITQHCKALLGFWLCGLHGSTITWSSYWEWMRAATVVFLCVQMLHIESSPQPTLRQCIRYHSPSGKAGGLLLVSCRRLLRRWALRIRFLPEMAYAASPWRHF